MESIPEIDRPVLSIHFGSIRIYALTSLTINPSDPLLVINPSDPLLQ